MDETILRNLDTQSRRLREIEEDLSRLLDDDAIRPTATPRVRVARAGSYAGLTQVNDVLRGARGWTDVDAAAALTAVQQDAFDAWRDRERLPWAIDDLVVVGLAGAVGFAATWFDADLDRALRRRLAGLKDTELIRSWERDGRRLAIDHTGPGFGGPDHRVRSSGHDLGRPIAALRQIRDGVFTGVAWEDGIRHDVERPGFRTAGSLTEALGLWAKHLAADFVTPMSLPLPGWTLLYEMPHRGLRKFAHEVYRGTELGAGLNIRSGAVSPSLALLATETIIRTHVHARAAVRTGNSGLTASEEALRDELLLSAHAVTAVASMGKAVARSLVMPTGKMALRHVNVPVLLRLGMLAVDARGRARARTDAAAPDWDTVLTDLDRIDADIAAGLNLLP